VLLVNDRGELSQPEKERAASSWIATWHQRLSSRLAERAFPSAPPEPEGKEQRFSYGRKYIAGKPPYP
jgi:hypothetical protein